MSASDNSSSTIVAPATSMVAGARLIIRLSGTLARPIVETITGRTDFAAAHAAPCWISFADLQYPAWVYAFHAPASYTGEDLFEFHLPGNLCLARDLIAQLISLGARPAEPGEFTARAFFNAKLDLTQAEGVSAVISANNDAELKAARQLLAGELAQRLTPLLDQLAQTLALVEVEIDFSEEEVTFLPMDRLRQQVLAVDTALQKLVHESGRLILLSHEPRIVLTGRPNAGKSSLLNALTHTARAVVSDQAGTTRDVLSAPIMLPHGQALLLDAAGLESADGAIGTDTVQSDIARSMQARALRAIESADCIVLVQDTADDRPPPPLPRPADLLVRTKLDLLEKRNGGFALSSPPAVAVSVVTGAGLMELITAIDRQVFRTGDHTPTFALNQRHLDAIDRCRVFLHQSIDLAITASPELIASELRGGLDALGSILGEVTADDLLGRVFATFCIGK